MNRRPTTSTSYPKIAQISHPPVQHAEFRGSSTQQPVSASTSSPRNQHKTTAVHSQQHLHRSRTSNQLLPPQQPTTMSAVAGAAKPATAEMPAQFVAAMRTLFDIMDDTASGFVRLSDIERRWQDDGAPGLPPGVVDSLRKVTPANGLLSFERFCAGLRICLTRSQNKGAGTSASKVLPSPPPPPALAAEVETKAQPKPAKALKQRISTGNTAAIRPIRHSSTLAQFPAVHRTLSLPKLSLDTSSAEQLSPLPAPPKPPRTALVLGNGVTNINHLDQLDRAEIRSALQHWQMGVLMGEMDAKDRRRRESAAVKRGKADGGSVDLTSGPATSTSSRSRREPRRHTLQNGIDQNLLRQLGQLEQEKELLQQGMAAVSATREWYARQLQEVQERIGQLGKSDSYSTHHATHAHQERLQLQRVRITQVNRTLLALTQDPLLTPLTSSSSISSSASPPTTATTASMHLAVRNTSTGINPPTSRRPAAPDTQQLREKNRQLADDVLEKSQYIGMLERERKTLIRELLQAQRKATKVEVGRGVVGVAGGLRRPRDKSADHDVLF